MYVADTFSFVFSASRTYKKVILYGYNQRYWNIGEKYFENGETKNRYMYICMSAHTYIYMHAYIWSVWHKSFVECILIYNFLDAQLYGRLFIQGT